MRRLSPYSSQKLRMRTRYNRTVGRGRHYYSFRLLKAIRYKCPTQILPVKNGRGDRSGIPKVPPPGSRVFRQSLHRPYCFGMSSRDVAREGSTTTTGSAHASLMNIIKVKPIQVVPRESKDSHARTSTSMDIFVGKSHAAGRFTTHVYGGQLVGQALMAAATTVMDTERTLHSMHCHFLQAGSHNEPFVFTVDRLRDGATYSSRFVVARQAGAAIFTAMCSFQQLHEYSDTNALQHQSTMPANVPPPESLPDQRETLLDAIRNARLSEEDKIRLKDSVDSLPPFPVDIRVVQPIQRIGPDSVKPREPVCLPLTHPWAI